MSPSGSHSPVTGPAGEGGGGGRIGLSPAVQPPPERTLEEVAYQSKESPRAEADLTCDDCGAPLRWSPDVGALTCEYCGAHRAVAVAQGTIVERPLTREAVASAARGLGREVRVLNCETCDARVTFEGASVSEACPFCGSPGVLSQEANRHALRPESLIPLEVGQERVKAEFHRWIHGLWFRPNALKETKRFDAIGVYVPAWTYDAEVHSDWSAQSGTYYYVTERYTTRENGRSVTRTRQVQKVRWRPAWGQRDDSYDDVLVIASRGIDGKLGQRLGPFAAEGLVPYSPEYLAGWHAEEYQTDLEAGWQEAKGRIEASQRSRCAGDVPGDTQRALKVQNRITDIRWKHVLLPMWSVTYQFRGKPYAVLVHGQSGRIVGRAPYSWIKILLFVLLLLAVAAVITATTQGR
ncbi:hypothetical protein Poly30_29440 [Planctomycetes bacterium Poly30]|uniref:DNA-directed RNA polymerase subunit P n=1 Tax=Saltatorellus ferox TaxID=2528018 RepID=A0A518ETL4_9BACT|nr:hypothetical protein Poly30_29440 [Planctomycetes bacterium Poly30]